MGTMIALVLNGIVLDYGKNRYRTNYKWLFPPNSTHDVEYQYAGNVSEYKPGLQASLQSIDFRLCNLGYSPNETKKIFMRAVQKWNRTANLRLTFEELLEVLNSVDFKTLAPADLQAHGWVFTGYLVHLLNKWDDENASLEDFIKGELDPMVILSMLAHRSDHQDLLLEWQYQDLVDSGWATLDDLGEIDRPKFIINHTLLFGRLHEYSREESLKGFDRWLAARGVAVDTLYIRATLRKTSPEKLTLPLAVRNMIHHPENISNTLSDSQLQDSIEVLLQLIQRLDEALPDLN